MPDLLKAKDVAAILGIDLNNVYKYFNDESFPSINIGLTTDTKPTWRVDKEKLIEWINERKK